MPESLLQQAASSAQERGRLLASFSGGETSGYMTHALLEAYSDKYDILVVFANTGQENEQTLEFIHRCDAEFGFETVWVEASVFHGERKSSGHRVVTFETASRDGEPYEDVIRKYGVPNTSFPHCTRELKLSAINSYLRSIGWNEHKTAIGIRTDERRRVAKNATTAQIVYPLLDWFPSDKQDVHSFWEDQSFRLQLKEHEGNCKWCWKKSDTKLLRLMTERAHIFDFPDRMERLYGHIGPEQLNGGQRRVFFRKHRSTEDMRRLHAELGSHAIRDSGDSESGCSESCELFPMEAS